MPTVPKLTIGMATYDDFDGVYFTVQALRMYHPQVLAQAEIIIVDNNPHGSHGTLVRSVVDRVTSATAGVKYIPMEYPTGTSPSRDRIFTEATAPYVLAMDCHVLIPPGGLARLLDYYKANPNTSDLLTGPLLYDTMDNIATHFNDEWRSEMWGTWGAAWQCPCPDGVRFSLLQEGGGNNKPPVTSPRLLAMGAIPLSTCRGCSKPIPVYEWYAHEDRYKSDGYIPLGYNDDDPPFEIPAQGLGLFTCRREAWQGFNPHALGFGGEELYIHSKFRAAGHKALCLPFLKWLHRFARPTGATYPLTRWAKVRNYVLEFNELGLPLDPIYDHFVATELMTEVEWQALIDDPIENKTMEGCTGCGAGRPGEAAYKTIDNIQDAFDICAEIPRDINEHLPKMLELGKQVEHITEFSGRRESTIAFMAAKPKTLYSYNTERDGLVDRMSAVIATGDDSTDFHKSHETSSQVASIESTDLLFLDQDHTYELVLSELEKYAPVTSRYIVLHDTQIHGETGSDGGPGILIALHTYLRKNPEWSVIYHTPDQYGLTVLGRRKEDKPKLPGKLTMAANLTKAIANHVTSGGGKVSDQDYEARLQVCNLCDQRVETRCAACGCYIDKKAAMQGQDCPLVRWPEQTPVKP